MGLLPARGGMEDIVSPKQALYGSLRRMPK
jgi:hypothetical protein